MSTATSSQQAQQHPGDGQQVPPPGAMPDFAAIQQAMGRVTADMSAAMASLMCALGLRFGLLHQLAAAGPATSEDLAAATGLDERYLREWLLCLASAGYLEAGRQARTFGLAPGLAQVLGGGPMDMSAGFRLIPALASMIEQVGAAFEGGGGVPPHRYPASLYAAMDQMSAGWLDAMLVHQWIPSVDGLTRRLAEGTRVADVGCGGGHALVLLAGAFPRSQFVGYDSDPASLERARAAAAAAGVADRISFACGDASDALDGHFGLVTAFDVLHDAPDPPRLLRQIVTAVRPDGVFLLLESNAADEPLDNTGPVATILYGTSVLYCLPVSRDAGGPGLGTLGLPSGRIRDWCAASGFRSIHAIDGGSPFNRLYEIRP